MSAQTLPVSALHSSLQSDDEDAKGRSTSSSTVNGDSNPSTPPETTLLAPVMESQQVQQPLSLRHGEEEITLTSFTTHSEYSQIPSQESQLSLDQQYRPDYLTSSSASCQEPFISNSDHLIREEPRLKPLSAAFASLPPEAITQPTEEIKNQENDSPYTTTTVVGGLPFIPFHNIHPETVTLSEDRVNDLQFKARQAAP